VEALAAALLVCEPNAGVVGRTGEAWAGSYDTGVSPSAIHWQPHRLLALWKQTVGKQQRPGWAAMCAHTQHTTTDKPKCRSPKEPQSPRLHVALFELRRTRDSLHRRVQQMRLS
jgi:hypothetical protein